MKTFPIPVWLMVAFILPASLSTGGCNGSSDWKVRAVEAKEGGPMDWIEESQQKILVPVVSPDENLLITISMDGDVGLYELYANRDLEDPVRLHENMEATHAAFSPSGEEYVIGTAAGKLIIVSTETGNELEVLEHEELGSIYLVNFEGRRLTALAENGVVVHWEKDNESTH